MADERPRWREDFPVRWDEDNYMTRRELAKFLTLGSGLLASVNVLIAVIGLTGRAPASAWCGESPPPTNGARRLAAVPLPDRRGPVHSGAGRGGSSTRSRRSAPTCRARSSTGRATRAGLPVPQGIVLRAQGLPLAGPPTRRLPRIVLERRGDESVPWASRSDVETREQGSTLFSAVLFLIAMLVVIQLWLVAAALDALLGGETGVLMPAAIASLCCSC